MLILTNNDIGKRGTHDFHFDIVCDSTDTKDTSVGELVGFLLFWLRSKGEPRTLLMKRFREFSEEESLTESRLLRKGVATVFAIKVRNEGKRLERSATLAKTA